MLSFGIVFLMHTQIKLDKNHKFCHFFGFFNCFFAKFVKFLFWFNTKITNATQKKLNILPWILNYAQKIDFIKKKIYYILHNYLLFLAKYLWRNL